MNYVPHRARMADELAMIQEIVSRHSLPEFVSGFEVRLGEFADNPAMWIIFKVKGDEPSSNEAMAERVKEIASLRTAVFQDLLDEFDDRWPYFRFEQAN